MVKTCIALLTLLNFINFFGCSLSNSNKKPDIVIGFNPAENADVIEAKAEIVAKLIEEKTGYKLKTFVATDFSALVEAMRTGMVHMAFLPPFSLIQAERIAKGKVLLKAVREGQSPYYYSAIITGKSFNSLQDLKGKTIAWTDPASASGHIIPKSSLMDAGIDPEEFFGKQVFAGGHDALVLSVANGTVDAGATFVNTADGSSHGAWHQFIKDPAQLKKIKVLHVSKPIPGDTFATTEPFYEKNKQTVDTIVQLLIDLGKTPEGKKVLMDLYRIDHLMPATSAEYEPLREAARRLKVFQ